VIGASLLAGGARQFNVNFSGKLLKIWQEECVIELNTNFEFLVLRHKIENPNHKKCLLVCSLIVIYRVEVVG